MWGTSGVELMGIMDSHLSWNTDSKGRHRAPRRPRTSFLADTKQKVCGNHLTKNDSPDKDLKCMDTPVYESEKLGVNILGHRFDSSLEGVPIKKRLLLSHSPSSSRVSPPNLLEPSDDVLGSQGLHHVNKKMEPHHHQSHSMDCYDADFSGISILAAAACDIRLSGCDIIDSEASVSKDEDYDCHHKVLRNVGSQKEDSSDAGVSDGKVDISGISAGVLSASAVEDGSCVVDIRFPDENMSCSNNIQFDGSNDASRKSNTSKRSDKLHWDLNKEMDAWEFPYTEDAEDAGLVDGLAIDDAFDDMPNKDEVCLDLVGHRAEHVVLGTCRIPSQIVSAYSELNAELDSINLSKNCASMGNTVDVSQQVHCAHEESDNRGPSLDNPCSMLGSAEETDASHEDFARVAGAQISFDQFAMVAQDEVHDPTEGSHDPVATVAPSRINTQRSSKNEDIASMPVEILTCRSASSKTSSLSADHGNNNGDIETTGNDSYHGCQYMEDVESSDSSKERHGNLEQVNCNEDTVNVGCHDEKEAEACNYPSNAALINKIGFNGACGSFSDTVLRIQDGNASKDYPIGSCTLDIIEIAAEQLTGMEQSEHNRDDDSQYEDGELRESVFHDWGEYGDVDGEDEHVDYGSDEGERYMCEDASDDYTCMVSHGAEKIDREILHQPEIHGNHPVPCEISKESSEIKSRMSGQYLDIKVAHKALPCSDDNGVKCAELISKGDDHSMQLDHSASLKMILPGPCLPSDPGVTTSSFKGPCKENVTEKPVMVKADKPCKNTADSKDLLSQCEGGRSSKLPRRKDGAFHQTSSGDNVGDADHTAKADHDHTAYSRKAGTSHLPEVARSKGYSCDEPLKQRILSQHERYGHYDLAGYGKAAPKNAVEAAAAKVESNGFAVAPDGTVVDPTRLESTNWSSRRNIIAAAPVMYRSSPRRLSSTGRDRMPQFERDDVFSFGDLSKCRIRRKASPDRQLNGGEGSYRHGFRHGLRMLSSSRKEKYSMQISDERIGSSCGHRTMSQGNHSPSFQRDSSLPRHCGRSRSRSRTRSPNAWTSPRRNDRGRATGDRRYRHCDRSPSDFRAGDRGELVNLPYRRVDYADRLPDMGPSFRNFASLSSRPFHETKDLVDDLGRHEYRVYRRSSDRSPPERFFPRSHRFDVLDPGRTDHDDYFREVHHGRRREFTSAGKRSRYDEDDGGRGRGNRYEMPMSSSSREYVALGGMEHLCSDRSNGRRLENAHSRTPPDDAFGSFVGGGEGQLGSPPRRSNDVKDHFRHARDIRRGSESKSAGLQERDKDANPLRRRLS